MNTSAYSTSQKLLHWVSAVIIVWALLSGFFVAVFSVPASVKAWVAFFNVSLTTVYIPVCLAGLLFLCPRLGLFRQANTAGIPGVAGSQGHVPGARRSVGDRRADDGSPDQYL